MMRQDDGFTLIELMVVIIIMMVIAGAMGWNYVRFRDRNAVEAAARMMRDTLNQAKNFAKIGQWSVTPNTFCYPGDLTAGYGNIKTTNASIAAQPPGESTDTLLLEYTSDLQVIAQKGLVLETYGVYWGRDSEANKLEVVMTCKRRASTGYDGSGRWSNCSCGNDEGSTCACAAGKQKPYFYGMDVVSTKYFNLGVSVLKPRRVENISHPLAGEAPMAGVEFTPLYLNVRAPLNEGQTDVDFGESCFGEEGTNNELIIGDTDYKYLYKMPVGMAGDVGEGCFCERGLREEEMMALDARGCLESDYLANMAESDGGPCNNICSNTE